MPGLRCPQPGTTPRVVAKTHERCFVEEGVWARSDWPGLGPATTWAGKLSIATKMRWPDLIEDSKAKGNSFCRSYIVDS